MAAYATDHDRAALVFLFSASLAAAGLLRSLVSPMLRRAKEAQAARAEAAARRRPVEIRVSYLGGATYQVLVNGERLWVGPNLARALEQAREFSRWLNARGFLVSPVSGPWRSPPIS